MRFEAKAAVVVGILLPVLETYRRGMSHWHLEFTTMFEDYLAGLLLLVGAWASTKRRPSQFAILLTAWAWVTGMMTISFVDQVETTIRGLDIEPQNTDVLVVKFLLLAISAAALQRSLRRLTNARDSPIMRSASRFSRVPAIREWPCHAALFDMSAS